MPGDSDLKTGVLEKSQCSRKRGSHFDDFDVTWRVSLLFGPVVTAGWTLSFRTSELLFGHTRAKVASYGVGHGILG